MTTEYRIRLTPGTVGGYWSGALGRTFTLYTEAEAALTEYRATVDRDTFISHRLRTEHLNAIRIEARTITDWHPTTDPRGEPLPHPSP